MPARLILLTYATDAFRKTADALMESATTAGFDETRLVTDSDIRATEFYSAHRSILDQPRGGGYWIWTPYIIREALERAGPNDIVFYCDAGRSPYYRFTRRPTRLERLVQENEQGFVLGPTAPHLGALRFWTKRDCLVLMGADTDELLRKPTLMTWSLWRPTPGAFAFLEAWLSFCCDPRCSTDMANTCGLDNHAEFRDHRHDQSILSILAHLNQAPHLDFSRTMTHAFIKLRPNSNLGHHFYKRPENADALLARDNPLVLVREYLRLRKCVSE